MSTTQNWRIPANKVNCIAGEEGVLTKRKRKATLKAFYKSRNCVALKCLALPPGSKWKTFIEKKLVEEVGCFAYPSHPNLVKTLGWTSFPGYITIISNYLTPGNIRFLIFDRKIHISSLMQLRFCKDISRGMAFLHGEIDSNDIAHVHGCLKLDNILLDHNLRCQIADSTLKKIVASTGDVFSSQDELSNASTDLTYVAPERLLDATQPASVKEDVYSIAIIMHDILTRHPVIASSTYLSCYLQMIKEGKRPDLTKTYTTGGAVTDKNSKKGHSLLTEAISECWKHAAASRPCMSIVHEWIKEEVSAASYEELHRESIAILKSINMESSSAEDYRCIPLMTYFSAENNRRTPEPHYLETYLQETRLPPSGASSSDESTVSSETTEIKQLFSSEGNNQPVTTNIGQRPVVGFETVLRYIQDVKESLFSDNVADAVAMAMKLASTQGVEVKGDELLPLLSRVCSLAEKFFSYSGALVIMSLLQFSMNLSIRIPKVYDALRIKRKIVETMLNAVKITDQKDLKLAAEFLRQVRDSIKQDRATSADEDCKLFAARVEARCLCSIGLTKNMMGKSNQAVEICREAQSLMISVFKDKAKEFEVFALSYSVMAECYSALNERVQARTMLEQALKFFKDSEKLEDSKKLENTQ